jgi:vacuolar protein sorting-associated protein 13A/C
LLHAVELKVAGQTNEPISATEGLMQGTRAFGIGLLSGLTGVVAQPIIGMRRYGVLGLVAGVGTGLLGLAARPTAGAFEALSLVSCGLASEIDDTGPGHALRIRLPRYLGSLQQPRLLAYSWREAIGAKLLREMNMGHEVYVFHMHVLVSPTHPGNMIIHVPYHHTIFEFFFYCR